MRRLSLAWKFALIAIVLVAPLAFATYSYYTTQNKQVEFAEDERAGLVVVSPLTDLLAGVAEARSAAARGNEAAIPDLASAVARVDAVLPGVAESFDVSGSWTALK